MLNYVWLALIVLGIGTAVYLDIGDSLSDKYKNGVPLRVNFTYKDSLITKEKSGSGVLLISSADFENHFGVKINSDLQLNSKFIYKDKKDELAAVVFVSENTPDILKKIASSAGEENDITAVITNLKRLSENSFSGSMALEQVTFIKMKEVTNAVIDYAGTAVQIAIGLIGIMALWLGVMKIAEEAGLIHYIAKILKPVTQRLFPDVPTDHPAMGAMIMNISANMLGLGNAATPFGLKAMEELDTLNPDKGTATNAMVTFLAINTAGLTLIPATAIAVRAAAGSSDPAIIIGTSVFGASCATAAGVISAKIFERFQVRKGHFKNWFEENKKILAGIIISLIMMFLIIITGVYKIITGFFSFINPESFGSVLRMLSYIAIPGIIFVFVIYGAIKKVKVYEQFVEGAKEGFNIAVRIIPYLVAMLMAIGIFRAGGAMDIFVLILQPVTNLIGMPAEALPMALMRPLSGSGSLGVMTEIMSVHGPDSFLGVLVSTFFGSTETTFYVLAVYFGAVNIRNTRHALAAGLIADIAGILGALFIVRVLFGGV